MRLEDENEHHETGWTPPLAHEHRAPDTAPTADHDHHTEPHAPDAVPVASDAPGYGWTIHERPQFGSETAPDFVPEVTATEHAEYTESSELAVHSADFPVSNSEPVAYEALPDTESGTSAEATPEPMLDEAARKKMLGEKLPPEWVKAYGAERAQRLRILNKKIEKLPDAPVNFVLRGELYLSVNELEQAAADFQQALTLAERLDAELDWGYINAAYIDRANRGLRQIT